MPIESATYIPDLNATYPLQTDPIAQWYAHMNLVKQVLRNQFPNISDAAVTATAGQINTAANAFTNAGSFLTIQNTGTAGGSTLEMLAETGHAPFYFSNATGLFYVVNGATPPAIVMTLDQSGNLTCNSVNATGGGSVLSGVIPSGGIIMWSGSQGSIPTGWFLCDGGNGTPNLVDKFVVGATHNYSVGSQGGGTTVTLTTDAQGSHQHGGDTIDAGAHSHSGSAGGYTLTINDIPSHTHAPSVTDPGHTHINSAVARPGGSGGAGAYIAGGTAWDTPAATLLGATTGISVSIANTGGGVSHSHSISADGTHQHGINVDGSHTHTATGASMPPFYALCFIMKS
jgi:hypothetical protein